MPGDPVKNTVKGAIEAIYGPLEKMLRTLAGPAAEEIGLSFRDSVQAWRFKRQVRLFEQVKKICEGACIDLQAVKLPLLFNIVDKATVEEDDDLQDIWANMLSNAADPERASLVTTAFPEILRQLCIDEVRFLNRVFSGREIEREPSVGHLSPDEAVKRLTYRRNLRLRTMRKWLINEVAERLAAVHLDNLKRLGLIEVNESTLVFEREEDRTLMHAMRFLKPGQCSLTALGYSFADACTIPPQKTIN